MNTMINLDFKIIKIIEISQYVCDEEDKMELYDAGRLSRYRTGSLRTGF